MRSGLRQSGMTMIEVLVALLVLSVGLLGAAMLQINALKHTDSAMRRMQVSFIAQDLFERIRANPRANYALASLDQAPSSGNLDVPKQQDLFDFAQQVKSMVGEDAEASIAMNGSTVTIDLSWNDSRAEQDTGPTQRLRLNSVVSSDRSVNP